MYIPKIPNKIANQPKWFNSHIRHKINCLRTLKRKSLKHPSETNKLKVKHLEDELQQIITAAKLDYESHLVYNFALTNSNKIFRYISSIRGQDGLPSLMSHNNITASNDKEKAQLFNNYFYSVFSADDNLSTFVPTTSPNTIEDIVITEPDVLDILQSLDVNKACGIDSISPKIFRYCALPLLKPICHLFSVSLSTSDIPTEWRTHCVVPIYKSGDKSLVSNYRPISLLCILSKVLERIVYNNLLVYLKQTLTVHQFGFLPGRSALQQLLLVTETLLSAKLTQAEVDIIYMDFRKAFDSVSHNRLLQKLQTIGVTGNLWNWLRSYLTNRFQSVRIGNYSSDLCHVLSGVPQGSVLGPLLFIVFINDLPECILSSIPFLFADDTKCLQIINSSNDINHLQEDINNVSCWSCNTNLIFNEAKFVHIHFWSRDSTVPYTYTVNDKTIPKKSLHKDLGITFTANLQWSEHYKVITTKAYQTLGLLRRTFKTNNIQVKKQLFISLVRSQLLYCSQIWRPQLIKDILTLERIQRRATKYILNDYESSYKSRLEQLHLLPLMYTYELNDLMFLIKCLKQPSDHFNIYHHIQFATSSTRFGNSNKLVHPKSSSSTHQHFYFNRIVRLWNHLPIIDTSLSIHQLKLYFTRFLWREFSTKFTSDLPCTMHIVCPCYRCSALPVSVNYESFNIINFDQ